MSDAKPMSEQAEKIFNLPSRGMETAQQMNVLLGTFSHLGQFLCGAQMNESEPREGGKLDGGVKMAVEATMINLCSRIDRLIADDLRWTLEMQQTVEKALSSAYDANAEMLRNQGAVYAEMVTPHYKFKPAIVKLGPGSWLAYCGNPADLDRCMCGVGGCPADAIATFDALFAGVTPEKLEEYLKQQTAITPKTDEQQKPLDTGTTPKTERPEKPKRARHRNRPQIGEDGGCSASEGEAKGL